MFAILFFGALVIGETQPDKAVTEAEKKEFLELVAKLPTKGEFFTDEAVGKASPFTRVLLALTEKDLEKRDLYPLLALSRGLIDRKKPRQYGLANFGKIAHPTIKLFWAVVLFRENAPPPEIVEFLRAALDSKEDARTLSQMTGPGFEELRAGVIRVYEAGRQSKVELVKKHTIDAFPEFKSGFDYTKKSYCFGPNQTIYAIRGLKQQGEVTVYDLAKGTKKNVSIPEPNGFKPKFDSTYFDNPVLAVNAQGDLLCRWDIGGNGDHGLGLLKKGSDSFQVTRVKISLGHCYFVANPDGVWYLIQGGPHFTVYQVDQDLKLKEIGDFSGEGGHSYDILSARFISNNVLHFFWGDVVSDNYLRMRCVDFDVKQQKWLHSRELFRLDKFVSSAKEPTVIQLKDDSVHYFWRVDEGNRKEEASGLYYQAETDGKTVKLGKTEEYRVVTDGKRIVVCYTQKDSPKKVFFRVLANGALGPVSELKAGREDEYNLSLEYMVLYAAGDRIWFANTIEKDTLYELKVVDVKKP
jgi:hypothetical protein